MQGDHKIQAGLVFAGVLLCVSASAGDKVQIRGSTSIEVPKPKNSIEELRNFRGPDRTDGDEAFHGTAAPAVSAYTTTPQTEKKLKELLDKKKNWIFMNPYEDSYDSKTDEFLQGEKSSGLYDHPLMQDDEKSLMQQFLDEGKPDSESETTNAEHGTREFSEARREIAAEHREAAQEKIISTAVETDGRSSFTLDQKTPSIFSESGLFQRKPGAAFGNTSFSSGVDRAEREELRMERDARDANIMRMLAPRSTPGSSREGAGTFNALNRTVGAMQEGTTIGTITGADASRGGTAVNFGRSEAAGVGTLGTIGTFGSGLRNGPVFSGSAPISSPARSGFDFGARAGASASSGFAPSAPSTPITSPSPGVAQRPFVLPLPQRKF